MGVDHTATGQSILKDHNISTGTGGDCRSSNCGLESDRLSTGKSGARQRHSVVRRSLRELQRVDTSAEVDVVTRHSVAGHHDAVGTSTSEQRSADH